MQYRADIDGLRAIAVLAVVLFHAHITAFSGGFIGVDIFFVISGFLITGILKREIEQGNFTFAHFYQKRIRRILPAYIALCVATTIIAFIVMPPDTLVRYAKSLFSSAIFASNFYYASEIDYFHNAAEEMPLLHMWSLSVEEQFYILWPVALLILGKKLQWRFMPALLVIGIIVNIAVTEWALDHKSNTMVFFFSPFRAWELMIGALLCFIPSTYFKHQTPATIAGFTGIACIVTAIVTYTDHTRFPGLSALLPCVGAALIILSNTHRVSLAARLLSLRPLVWFGLISYSLYLWHWPIFAYVRFIGLEQPSPATITLMIIGSITAGYLSWKYIETPYRSSTHRFIIPYGAAGLCAVSLAAIVFITMSGFPVRASKQAMQADHALSERNPLTEKCLRNRDTKNLHIKRPECITRGSENSTRAVLWGDSHANAIWNAVDILTKEQDMPLEMLAMQSCDPTMSNAQGKRAAQICAKFNKKVKEYIVSNDTITTVYLSSYRTSLVSTKQNMTDDKKIQNYIHQLDINIVQPLLHKGKQVVIIGQPPEFTNGGGKCVARTLFLGLDTKRCAISFAQYKHNAGRINAALGSLAKHNRNVQFIDVASVFCRKGICSPLQNGYYAYLDKHHLNKTGSQLVGKYLVNHH